MQLIDTHCHLDFPDYKDDLDEVIKRAASVGVVRIIVPGTDVESSTRAVELAATHPSIYAAVGAHPHAADKTSENGIARLRDMTIANEKIVAVGEIGLDYYRKYSDVENQKKLFKGCLEIARSFDLPVILHNRNADEDFLSILKEAARFPLRGVVHCFSSDKDVLRELLFLGMHISFTGSITFKKADKLRDIIKNVPIEKLLLETDSPFITPEPLRGKRNEPANVKYLLDVYSDVYGMTAGDIAEATTRNANRLFGLGIEERGKIVYGIRESLYINVTNRCTNRCTFCTRQSSDLVKGHDLRMDRDPTAKETIAAIGDVSAYDEIVFCGYGEPALRLGFIKEVASYIKSKDGRVRMVTNGEGDIINGKSVAVELKGLVDRVSVSLNTPEPDEYNSMCNPLFEGDVYGAIIDFIKGCKKSDIKVEITCLDIAGDKGVEGCRRMAEEMNVDFRLRHMDVVG